MALAKATLGTSIGTVYTSTNDSATTSIFFTNDNAAARTIDVHLVPNSGTADATNRIALHADMLISDVNEYLGINLSTTSSGTIGSLVQQQVMHSPKIGDEIVIRPSLIKMRIEDMEGTKVTKLSVSVSDATHTINHSDNHK